MVHTVKDKVLVIAFAAGRLRLLFAACVVMPLACVVGGCSGDGDARRLLDRAEVLMEEHPDSALAAVDSIDPGVLHSDCDRARYALLTTQAMVKNYRPVESDSLISVAVSYYRREAPSSPEMMKSLFYQAQVRYDLDYYDAAIVPAMKSRELAIEGDDTYWRAKTAELVADIYYQSYYNQEVITYNQEAVEYYKLAGKIRNHRYALCDLAANYGYNGQKAESYKIFDSILNLAEMKNGQMDTLMFKYCLMSYFPIAIKFHDRIKSKSLYEQLTAYGFLDSSNAASLAYSAIVLIDDGCIDMGLDALRCARQLAHERDLPLIYQTYAQYYINEGVFNEACHYTDSILCVQNAVFRELLDQSVMTECCNQLTLENINVRHKTEFQTTIIVVGILLFFIIMLGIGWCFAFKIRLKNLKIENVKQDMRAMADRLHIIQEKMISWKMH